MFDANSTVYSRRAECMRLLTEHPGTVPVAAQQASHANAYPTVFAVFTFDRSTTVTDFVSIIDCESIGPLLVDGHTPAACTLLTDLHDYFRDEDGFLYITVLPERGKGKSGHRRGL